MDIELNTEKMTARIEDGIGWMTFNNPERHNALALEMWQGMGDILEAFNSNELSLIHISETTRLRRFS